jgi:preprotein translocase subunit SecA
MIEAKLEIITRRLEIYVNAAQRGRLSAPAVCWLGTERHESRRIDNHAGRAVARATMPAQFFPSLRDDPMRTFGSDKLDGMLRRGCRRTRRSSTPDQRRWRRRSRKSRRATSTARTCLRQRRTTSAR